MKYVGLTQDWEKTALELAKNFNANVSNFIVITDRLLNYDDAKTIEKDYISNRSYKESPVDSGPEVDGPVYSIYTF